MAQPLYEDHPPEPCEEAQALVPAYCLDMTDVEETRLVEAMLDRCPRLRQEIVAYRALALAFLAEAPPVAAPANIAYRLVEQTAREQTARAAESSPHRGVALPVTAAPSGARGKALSIAAAAVLVLVVAGLLLWRDTARERAVLAEQLALHTEIVTLLHTGELVRFDLTALDPDAQPPARAVLRCAPDSTVGTVVVENFPPPPAGRVYQLWLSGSGGRTLAGAVGVGDDGRGTLVFRAPLAMRSFQYAGITLDSAPDAASPAPAAVVRGRLY